MGDRGESNTVSMASVLAALDGEPFPLDGSSSKVLRFMLEHVDGCDVTISRDAFEIRFGWHPSRHRYFLHLAAPVVSELLRLARYAGPIQRLAAPIGPATIPALDFTSWSFGKRVVWLDRSVDMISIHIRDAHAQATLPEGPPTLPEPIGYKLELVDFPSPMACQRCNRESLRYRRLADGALLCPACARTFTLGDLP
jgi:hypothetical protein